MKMVSSARFFFASVNYFSGGGEGVEKTPRAKKRSRKQPNRRCFHVLLSSQRTVLALPSMCRYTAVQVGPSPKNQPLAFILSRYRRLVSDRP